MEEMVTTALLLCAVLIVWGLLATAAIKGWFVDYLTPKRSFTVIPERVQRAHWRILGWIAVVILSGFLIIALVLNIKDMLSR